MKKTISILLVLVVGVIMTACSDETQKNETNSISKNMTENKISNKEEKPPAILDVSNSLSATDLAVNYDHIQIISEAVENGKKTIKVFYPKDSLYLPTKYHDDNSYKGELKLDNAKIATNGWIAAFSGILD